MIDRKLLKLVEYRWIVESVSINPRSRCGEKTSPGTAFSSHWPGARVFVAVRNPSARRLKPSIVRRRFEVCEESSKPASDRIKWIESIGGIWSEWPGSPTKFSAWLSFWMNPSIVPYTSGYISSGENGFELNIGNANKNLIPPVDPQTRFINYTVLKIWKSDAMTVRNIKER